MLKLVRLEWKKNNIGKYIKGVIIMAALLGLFVFALAFLGIARSRRDTRCCAWGRCNLRSHRIIYKHDFSYLHQCNVGILYCKRIQKQDHESDVFLPY